MLNKYHNFLHDTGSMQKTVGTTRHDKFIKIICLYFRNEYVYHPINSFHLMKRAVIYWPKIKEKYPNVITYMPEKRDFVFGASYGIISIQAYHNLDMFTLSQGIIKDPFTNYKWFASKNMSSEDLSIIASTAKKVHKYF